MTNLLQKNPFSLYDFLGYLFPGAFALFLIIIVLAVDNLTFNEIVCLFRDNAPFQSINVFNTFFFIVVSYILGHILSYISSITIERWSLWLFGYPSEFLLDQRKNTSYWNSNVTSCGTQKEAFDFNDISKSIYFFILKRMMRFLMGLFLLPIYLPYVLLMSVNMKGFITKPLDIHIRKSINDKVIGLANLISFTVPNNEDVDYSRIILHYYAHKQSILLFQKTDNYVALYGFLRSITLVLNLITLIIFILSICQDTLCINIGLILIFSILSFISFLAFMKFYRRYSLEVFMYLISDPEVPVSNNLNQ